MSDPKMTVLQRQSMIHLSIEECQLDMNVSEREFECKVNINGVTTDVLFPLKMSVDITLFCKDDFLTLVFLKLQGELIGSVTFSFNDFREINTFKRWITLFQPNDDCYDGDLQEDDMEFPRVLLHFKISQIHDTITSEIQDDTVSRNNERDNIKAQTRMQDISYTQLNLSKNESDLELQKQFENELVRISSAINELGTEQDAQERSNKVNQIRIEYEDLSLRISQQFPIHMLENQQRDNEKNINLEMGPTKRDALSKNDDRNDKKKIEKIMYLEKELQSVRQSLTEKELESVRETLVERNESLKNLEQTLLLMNEREEQLYLQVSSLNLQIEDLQLQNQDLKEQYTEISQSLFLRDENALAKQTRVEIEKEIRVIFEEQLSGFDSQIRDLQELVKRLRVVEMVQQEKLKEQEQELYMQERIAMEKIEDLEEKQQASLETMDKLAARTEELLTETMILASEKNQLSLQFEQAEKELLLWRQQAPQEQRNIVQLTLPNRFEDDEERGDKQDLNVFESLHMEINRLTEELNCLEQDRYLLEEEKRSESAELDRLRQEIAYANHETLYLKDQLSHAIEANNEFRDTTTKSMEYANQVIQQKQSEIEGLHSQIDVYEEKAEKLLKIQQESVSFKTEGHDKTENTKEINQIIKMSDEQKDLELRLNAKSQENNELRESINLKEEEILQLKQQIEQIQNDMINEQMKRTSINPLTHQDNSIAELEGINVEGKFKNEIIQKDLLIAELAKSQDQIRIEFSQIITHKDIQIAELENIFEELHTKLNESEFEKETQITEHAKMLAEMQRQFDLILIQKETLLETTLNTMQKQSTETEIEKTKQIQEREKLQKQIQELETTLEDQKKRQDDILIDKYEEIAKQKGIFEEMSSKLNEDITNKVNLIGELENTLRVTSHDLNETIRDKNIQIQDLKDEIQEITKNLLQFSQQQEAQNSGGVQEISKEFNQTIMEKDAQILELEKTLNEQNSMMDELMKSKDNQTEDLEKALSIMHQQLKDTELDRDRQIIELQTQLNEMNSKQNDDELIEFKDKQIGELEKSLNILHEKLNDTEADRDRQIIELQTQLNEMNSKQNDDELIVFKDNQIGELEKSLSIMHQKLNDIELDRDRQIIELQTQFNERQSKQSSLMDEVRIQKDNQIEELEKSVNKMHQMQNDTELDRERQIIQLQTLLNEMNSKQNSMMDDQFMVQKDIKIEELEKSLNIMHQKLNDTELERERQIIELQAFLNEKNSKQNSMIDEELMVHKDNQIVELEKELNIMHQKLNDIELERERQINENQTSLNSIQNSIIYELRASKDNQIEELEKSLNTMHQKLNDTELDRDRQIIQLQALLSEMNNKQNSMMDDELMLSKDDQIADLEKNIIELTRQLKDISDHSVQTQQSKDNQIADLEKDVNELTRQLKEISDHSVETQFSTMQSKDNQIAELEKDVNELRRQLKDISDHSVETQFSTQQSKDISIMEQNAYLEQQYKVISEDFNTLKKQQNDIQVDRDTMFQEIKVRDNLIEEQQSQIKLLSQQLTMNEKQAEENRSLQTQHSMELQSDINMCMLRDSMKLRETKLLEKEGDLQRANRYLWEKNQELIKVQRTLFQKEEELMKSRQEENSLRGQIHSQKIEFVSILNAEKSALLDQRQKNNILTHHKIEKEIENIIQNHLIELKSIVDKAEAEKQQLMLNSEKEIKYINQKAQIEKQTIIEENKHQRLSLQEKHKAEQQHLMDEAKGHNKAIIERYEKEIQLNNGKWEAERRDLVERYDQGSRAVLEKCLLEKNALIDSFEKSNKLLSLNHEKEKSSIILKFDNKIQTLIEEFNSQREEMKNEADKEKLFIIRRCEIEKQDLIQAAEIEKRAITKTAQGEKEAIVQGFNIEKRTILDEAEREKYQIIEHAEREKHQIIELAEKEKQNYIERAENEKHNYIEHAEREKLEIIELAEREKLEIIELAEREKKNYIELAEREKQNYIEHAENEKQNYIEHAENEKQNYIEQAEREKLEIIEVTESQKVNYIEDGERERTIIIEDSERERRRIIEKYEIEKMQMMSESKNENEQSVETLERQLQLAIDKYENEKERTIQIEREKQEMIERYENALKSCESSKSEIENLGAENQLMRVEYERIRDQLSESEAMRQEIQLVNKMRESQLKDMEQQMQQEKTDLIVKEEFETSRLTRELQLKTNNNEKQLVAKQDEISCLINIQKQLQGEKENLQAQNVTLMNERDCLMNDKLEEIEKGADVRQKLVNLERDKKELDVLLLRREEEKRMLMSKVGALQERTEMYDNERERLMKQMQDNHVQQVERIFFENTGVIEKLFKEKNAEINKLIKVIEERDMLLERVRQEKENKIRELLEEIELKYKLEEVLKQENANNMNDFTQQRLLLKEQSELEKIKWNEEIQTVTREMRFNIERLEDEKSAIEQKSRHFQDTNTELLDRIQQISKDNQALLSKNQELSANSEKSEVELRDLSRLCFKKVDELQKFENTPNSEEIHQVFKRKEQMETKQEAPKQSEGNRAHKYIEGESEKQANVSEEIITDVISENRMLRREISELVHEKEELNRQNKSLFILKSQWGGHRDIGRGLQKMSESVPTSGKETNSCVGEVAELFEVISLLEDKIQHLEEENQQLKDCLVDQNIKNDEILRQYEHKCQQYNSEYLERCTQLIQENERLSRLHGQTNESYETLLLQNMHLTQFNEQLAHQNTQLIKLSPYQLSLMSNYDNHTSYFQNNSSSHHQPSYLYEGPKSKSPSRTTNSISTSNQKSSINSPFHTQMNQRHQLCTASSKTLPNFSEHSPEFSTPLLEYEHDNTEMSYIGSYRPHGTKMPPLGSLKNSQGQINSKQDQFQKDNQYNEQMLSINSWKQPLSRLERATSINASSVGSAVNVKNSLLHLKHIASRESPFK